LANFSPGLERSDNPEISPSDLHTNPEGVRRERNPFRVDCCRYSFDPRVVAALQLWAEISLRLRRICVETQTDD
jgi:hypothetical protein